MHIYTYILTHIQTYMHTYIHTYMMMAAHSLYEDGHQKVLFDFYLNYLEISIYIFLFLTGPCVSTHVTLKSSKGVAEFVTFGAVDFLLALSL